MLHRDYIVIEKVLSEIDLGLEMLGNTELESFLEDEKLKRALSMTVINIGELIKNITQETRSEYPEVQWQEVRSNLPCFGPIFVQRETGICF